MISAILAQHWSERHSSGANRTLRFDQHGDANSRPISVTEKRREERLRSRTPRRFLEMKHRAA
jgi:hypothetical protein